MIVHWLVVTDVCRSRPSVPAELTSGRGHERFDFTLCLIVDNLSQRRSTLPDRQYHTGKQARRRPSPPDERLVSQGTITGHVAARTPCPGPPIGLRGCRQRL